MTATFKSTQIKNTVEQHFNTLYYCLVYISYHSRDLRLSAIIVPELHHPSSAYKVTYQPLALSCDLQPYIYNVLHIQQSPNPLAQYPLAEPDRAAHSRAVIHVPLSPEAPAHAPFAKVTTVNSDRTEKYKN